LKAELDFPRSRFHKEIEEKKGRGWNDDLLEGWLVGGGEGGMRRLLRRGTVEV
jgi:hypothetical protein